MSREEVTVADSQQTTSTNRESREIPISTTAPKKSASHPSLQAQQSQNEQNLTAESSQEIKMNLGRKQQKDKNKDILKSNNAYQSVSGKDIINNNKSANNGNTSTTASNVINSGGVDENSNVSFNNDSNISGGDTGHDPFQENGVSIPRRQSMNDNSQRLLKSHSMHQRHNSTPISSSISLITTNTSISSSPPSSPSSSSNNDNNNNIDNTNPDNTNNTNTSTTTSTNATYSNGINMPSQIYEETPQMSYPNMNPSTPFMPVPSQYFTPFFPNNGQYFYDPQYNRFGRPPHQIPPSAQQTFVRSNVYPYHQIPVIPPMHPPPYHSPSPLISHQSLPARYLNPSSAGGDSGFSSRRSSLDQVRTPEFGPQHSPRIQRKPKQLDKALWVGNLPDSTTYDELKEFFADVNMESVFHIKKSNCAFVNYKTYDAVMEAVHKYNDMEFKGIKLVCRPRKQTPADLKLKTESLSDLISENTPPPTPSEAGSTASSTRSRRSSLPPRQRIRQSSIASMSPASSVSSLKPSSQNRYFILKSLTQDDLDISVKSGYWATQPHNEAALNKAFKVDF
ncbi:hypothetical protein C1645_514735 [Glomus cerebriforme]|uniref:RRM domain-containing protein n=1 Tax=Glomus cerebriforme TaxID=658196 RepID=A0A397T9P9_9GLOM|nr:hypothetical protein C1645_514735 [Glomus cerebriforme]